MSTRYFTTFVSGTPGLEQTHPGTGNNYNFATSTGQTLEAVHISPIGDPGSSGTTGDFSADLVVTSSSSDHMIRVRWARYSEIFPGSGDFVEFATTNYTSEQASSVGTLTFNLNGQDLGTWGTRDRLVLVISVRDTRTMGGGTRTTTVNHTSGTTFTDAPWGGGPTNREGDGAGSFTVTGGSASAQRTTFAEAAGSFTLAGGSASAQVQAKVGTGAGAITVTGGDASAVRIAEATAAGSLTLTGGDATGARTALATAAGSLALSGGSAEAQRSTFATAAGSISLAGGSADAQRFTFAEASGEITLSGGSASAKVVRVATASGSISVTGGDADTLRTAVASGVASVTISIGNAEGKRTTFADASGSFTISGGSATTHRHTFANAEGAISVTGGDAASSAQGNRSGTGAGELTVTGGSASGQRTTFATAEAAIETAGAAFAQRTTFATASGSITVQGGNAIAGGVGNRTGTGEGDISIAADADGLRTTFATAEGALELAADADGQRTTSATASGSFTLSGGDADAARTSPATAEGSLSIVGGDADTQRTARATAHGIITVTGGDAGTRRLLTGVAEGLLTINAWARAPRPIRVRSTSHIESAVSKWLRADDYLAGTIGDRAYTVLPRNSDEMPRIRITRLGGAPDMPDPLWLESASIQVEVWDHRMASVESLSHEVVRALAEMKGEDYEGIVFSKVEIRNMAATMDGDLTPPTPKMILDVEFRMRPSSL